MWRKKGRALTICPVAGARLLALLVILIAAPAFAQPQATPVRIGVLTTAWGPPIGVEGLVGGLVDLGYRENYDFVVGVRFTQGDPSALPAAAKAMVDRGVDILVAFGALAAEAAQEATSTHPIVFMSVGDPVGRGLVESYARPGGNITGVTDLSLEVSGKRLQLFQEMVPGLRRVLFAYNEDNPYDAAQAQEYRNAAQSLNLVLVERALSTPGEARALMTELRELDIDGILSPQDVDLNIPGFILEVSARQNIPSMFDTPLFVEEGGLASYGGFSDATGRQAARLIQDLMNGVDPGKVPVETARQLEFVINLRVAGQLGIVVPPVVLFQADRIVQ